MPSFQSYFIYWYLLRLKRKNANKPKPSLSELRALMDKMGDNVPLAQGTQSERISANAIPCEWVSTPKSHSDRVILYFHGGSYRAGSCQSHRGMVSHIADYTQSKVLMVDYRLAPENPFPAGLDDAVTVYDWLSKKLDSQRIIIAGDSAGGGMTMALLLKIKEENLPKPAAAILLCPWVDLEMRNPTLDTLANKDPWLDKNSLSLSAKEYYAQNTPQNPFVSPLNADLNGLPPLLIQLGGFDILQGEGEMLAKKAIEAGVKVQWKIWPRMIHVWQFIPHRLPEARKALQEMAEFGEKFW
jgi:acetyl esterase/lipase